MCRRAHAHWHRHGADSERARWHQRPDACLTRRPGQRDGLSGPSRLRESPSLSGWLASLLALSANMDGMRGAQFACSHGQVAARAPVRATIYIPGPENLSSQRLPGTPPISTPLPQPLPPLSLLAPLPPLLPSLPPLSAPPLPSIWAPSERERGRLRAGRIRRMDWTVRTTGWSASCASLTGDPKKGLIQPKRAKQTQHI